MAKLIKEAYVVKLERGLYDNEVRRYRFEEEIYGIYFTKWAAESVLDDLERDEYTFPATQYERTAIPVGVIGIQYKPMDERDHSLTIYKFWIEEHEIVIV